MRILFSTLLCLFLATGISSAQDEKPAEKPAETTKEPESPFKTLKDRASYGIGQNLASQIKFSDELDLDFSIVIQGFQDSLEGKDSKMTELQIQNAMLELQDQLRAAAMKKQEAQDEEFKKEYAEVIKQGEDFLAKNGKRKGVTTTKSGLQYEVIKEGTGKVSPKPTDTVTTHYHGTLLDGTVFDSSVERGEPIDFGVGRVIAGWTEGLQLMNVGDKYKLYVPYDLAYGKRSVSEKIGPYSTLIFEVELIAINGEK